MSISVPILLPDEELNRKVKLLNQKQRHVFDRAHDGQGDTLKMYILKFTFLFPVSIGWLHIFII